MLRHVNFMTRKPFITSLCLAAILLAAAGFRFVGINWDYGYQQHPDERMLMLVASRIRFFDKLDPDFFNYGSFPVYCVRAVAQLSDALFHTRWANYDGMLFVGRVLVSLLDILMVYCVYRLADKLFRVPRLSLCAAAFYALSFFPIQNSNFYIVDNFVNFFLTLLCGLLLLYLKKASLSKVAGLAALFAVLLATKVTPVIYLPVILLMLFFQVRGFRWHLLRPWYRPFQYQVLFVLLCLACHFVLMPYAYIRFDKFWSDITLQMQMSRDPYVFPYTLQYVGTKPYSYYFINMFFWGLGPMLSSFFLLGLLSVFLPGAQQAKRQGRVFVFVLVYVLWNFYYFAVLGRSAVKFMRYMLPLYPFAAVMAAAGFEWTLSLFKRKKMQGLYFVAAFGFIFLWTVCFVDIYSRPLTRIEASKWINRHIPAGAVLAVEHWDERLPLFGVDRYVFVELPLYEYPDQERKWAGMKDKLRQADYIIIASQKLFVPLQKLGNCQEVARCYPRSGDYYRKLFAGQLGFEKVAEFTSYPGLTVLGRRFDFPDDQADESFSVYDHPRVYIFQKRGFSQSERQYPFPAESPGRQ